MKNVSFNSTIQKLMMSFPEFKGSWIFYSALYKFFPKKTRYYQLTDNQIYLDVSDPAQFSIVKTRHGQHEIGTVNFLKRNLKPGDIFIDIGANFGYFSAIASQLVGDNGLVLAFEPNPGSFLQLLSTITRNKLFNCFPNFLALGEQTKTTTNIRKYWFRQSTSSYMVKGTNVLANTLDNFLEKFNFDKKIKIIKIDVEGAELPVIHGLLSTLKSHQPTLIIEPDYHSESRFGYRFSELISFLTNSGYKPIKVLDPQGEGLESEYKEGVTYKCPIVFAPLD